MLCRRETRVKREMQRVTRQASDAVMSWHMWEGVEFYLITFALLGLVHVANIRIDLNIMLARMERK
jgi:hypothetical protein